MRSHYSQLENCGRLSQLPAWPGQSPSRCTPLPQPSKVPSAEGDPIARGSRPSHPPQLLCRGPPCLGQKALGEGKRKSLKVLFPAAETASCYTKNVHQVKASQNQVSSVWNKCLKSTRWTGKVKQPCSSSPLLGQNKGLPSETAKEQISGESKEAYFTLWKIYIGNPLAQSQWQLKIQSEKVQSIPAVWGTSLISELRISQDNQILCQPQ